MREVEEESFKLTSEGKLSCFYMFPPEKWYYNEKQLDHVIKYIELCYKHFKGGILVFILTGNCSNFVIKAFDRFYGMNSHLSKIE